MVADWVARHGDAPVRRDALLKSAGAARAHDMDRVIGLLLRAGLIETEERFERGTWRLVENLSSFERVARSAVAGEAVLWLPGYPPSWWLGAVRTLLAAAPAPALIACDPDPDGIAIALQAAAPWRDAGLDWMAWKMSADDLADLPVRRPLTGRDRERLHALPDSGLPPVLDSFARLMLEHGETGEQEAML